MNRRLIGIGLFVVIVLMFLSVIYVSSEVELALVMSFLFIVGIALIVELFIFPEESEVKEEDQISSDSE